MNGLAAVGDTTPFVAAGGSRLYENARMHAH